MRSVPERDWKYMKGIREELLSALCLRINRKAQSIVRANDGSEHDKYLALYGHIKESDRIVGECFNDWRRSVIWSKILALRNHGLLTDAHVDGLSAETRDFLKRIKTAYEKARRR